MTRVEQLEQQIVQLDPHEIADLRDWLLEHSRRSDTPQVSGSLDALRAEFDRELAVLQLPGASEKLLKAFASTPTAIAEAANAARKP